MEKLNIIKVLKYFVMKAWIIVLIALLSLGIGFVYYSSKDKKIIYQSEVNVLVNVNTANIQTQNSIVLTYSQIAKSKTVLERVIQELNLDIEYKDIVGKVSISYTENSKIIKIKTSSISEEMAIKIANSVARQFYQRIDELFDENIVTILEEADVATKSSSKLTTKNLFSVTIVGVILGMSAIFVFYYFDNKIKDEEIIKLNFDIPVLGRIHRNKKRINEDIEVIKTNIKYIQKENKTILLTNSVSKGSKVFNGESIARAMASEEEKILFVDWSNGISKSNKEEIDIKETDTKNLYLCNISNIENENNVKELINKFEKEYDHIIITGTPIIGYSDSLMLSTIVDSTIIMVKIGHTKLNKLEETVKSLKLVKANVSGIIVENA